MKPDVTIPDGPAPTELILEDLEVGTGAEAVSGKSVTVHDVGVSGSTGSEFDSSWNRDELFSFPLGAGHVIQGWDEGVAGMQVGGRRRITIPPELGYGAQGAGGLIPGACSLGARGSNPPPPPPLTPLPSLSPTSHSCAPHGVPTAPLRLARHQTQHKGGATLRFHVELIALNGKDEAASRKAEQIRKARAPRCRKKKKKIYGLQKSGGFWLCPPQRAIVTPPPTVDSDEAKRAHSRACARARR